MTTDQDFSAASSPAADGTSQTVSPVASPDSSSPAASADSAEAKKPAAPKRRTATRATQKSAAAPRAPKPPKADAQAQDEKADKAAADTAPKARSSKRATSPASKAAPKASPKTAAASEDKNDSPAKAKAAPTPRARKGRDDAAQANNAGQRAKTAPAKPEATAKSALVADAPAPEKEKVEKPAPQRAPKRAGATPSGRAAQSPAPSPATATAEASPHAPQTDAPAKGSDTSAPVKSAKQPTEQNAELADIQADEKDQTGRTEAPETENDGDAEAPRRKSRRGRRGGRGRNRKTRPDAAQDATDEVSAAPADEAPLAARSVSEAPEASTSVSALPDDEDYEDGETESAEAESDARAPEKEHKSNRGGRNAETESGKKSTVRATAVKAKSSAATGKKRMFISVLPGEQVEVALAEEGNLLEYYLDMLHQRKIKGNIYKAVIHNIDTNLQAAFVSYGAGKNGFLQIDEIHPEYWQSHHEPAKGKKFPPIQKVLKPGQEVLVQVVKEPTGNKGAFLTTWLSLAGRFLVLTPGQEQIGVSRKVDNDEERARLREMMNGIDPGQGLGVIVRTVSAGTTKTTLKNDLQYLKRLWRDIRKKATEVSAPALIHQEPGLPERAVRDYLTEDVCEIWVDNEDVAQGIRDTVSLLFPRKKDLVRLHGDIRQSMWERFSLRRQLDQIYSREVILPSGGRLVFDQTEALMAIDINSGKISGKGNFEAMAYKTNMEAAESIARQLRLRDVGGQVVIDFIEMRDKKHVLEVEKTLRQAMKNDRARHDVARMSSFGLLELVRQRTGSSALAITMEPCPACGGTGQRRNLEWQALQGLRELRRILRGANGEKCVFQTTRELGLYLLNHKRDTLREMEQDFGKCLEIAIGV